MSDPTPPPQDNEPSSREKLINRVLSVVLVLIIGANAWYYFSRDAKPATQHALADTPAPTFNLPRLDPPTPKEKSVKLEELQGKVVLLDFWATYCKPCKTQMPILQSIYNELPREQFTIVSINGDDPSNSKRNAKVSSYIQRSKYTFPVALDNGSTMNRYQVRRIPTLMILDPKGTIRYVHTGVTSKSDLLDEINKLIPN